MIEIKINDSTITIKQVKDCEQSFNTFHFNNNFDPEENILIALSSFLGYEPTEMLNLNWEAE